MKKPLSTKPTEYFEKHNYKQKKKVPVNWIENVLMDKANFKKTRDIDQLVPSVSGLYCIRIDNAKYLNEPFKSILFERGDNILYIGIATKSLKSRMLGQELRANGHGTFFRSIGASLGHLPPKGSLIDKANKRNFKFSEQDEKKIITWINTHLLVNWVEVDTDFDNLESYLINKYIPLFNIAKNPACLQLLKDLRRDCVLIANHK